MADRPDGFEEWPKKAEVAERLGVTDTSIVRFTKDGALNPVKDDNGAWRYPPHEVAILEEKRGGKKYLRSAQERSDMMQEWQADAVKEIVGLIKEPRVTIDKIQFEIIADLRARVKELEAERKEMISLVETAKDNHAEREAALYMVKSETNIKQLAMTRIIEKGGQLLMAFAGGMGSIPAGGAVQLTPKQLQELIIAGQEGSEKFLTPEQEKLAQAIVDRDMAEQKAKVKADDEKRSASNPS